MFEQILSDDDYKQLVDFLNAQSLKYYNDAEPDIPDATYDELFRKLKAYEDKHPKSVLPISPTQRIGAPVMVRHKQPHKRQMQSLDNAFNEVEFSEFLDRCYELTQSTDMCSELKFDGLAISIHYRDGMLDYAVTRGDGNIGELITENVKAIANVPMSIPYKEDIEIRGECVISKQSFARLNDAQRNKGEKLYINARNAIAGIVRQFDPKRVWVANPSFYCYDVIGGTGFTTQAGLLEFSQELGFVTSPYGINNGLNSCMEAYGAILNSRADLPFDIDGVVFKLNDLAKAAIAGSTARVPRTSVAFKLPPEEVQTELLDVEFQVGRTGVVTPVAKISPVFVGGVTVSSVTLHNADEIKRLGAMIGDQVIVRRAGDVIPEIVKVVSNFDKLVGGWVSIKFPCNCPSCGGPLEKDIITEGSKTRESVAWRCNNTGACPAQLLTSLQHFASRKAMNIQGLGPSMIEWMIESGMVNDVLMLMRVPEVYPPQVAGTQSKNFEKVCEEIKQAHNTTLPRFIYSLGIRDVGESAALVLAKYFKTPKAFFDTFCDLNKVEELSIPDIGPVTKVRIYRYLQSERNFLTVHGLITRLAFAPMTESIHSEFTGKRIVITGSFGDIGRTEIGNRLKELGAEISDSVSAKTDLLICGSNAGTKLANALKHNVPVKYDLEGIFNN